MKILINGAKPFEAAVILRFLYYATGFENLEIYITNFKSINPLIRYSRVPIEEVRKSIIFNELPKGNFLIVSEDGEDISNINLNEYDGILIDFENKHEGKKVKGLGIKLLHYEAISVLTKIFLENKIETKIPKDLNQEISREMIYFARKILEGIIFLDNFYFVSPRLILFALRHIHKKFKILVDEIKTEIIKDNKNIKEKIHLAFYDKKLRKFHEDVAILDNNILEIPIVKKDEIKRYKFFIDFDRRRVHLTEKFFVSEETNEENIKDFFENFLKFKD